MLLLTISWHRSIDVVNERYLSNNIEFYFSVELLSVVNVVFVAVDFIWPLIYIKFTMNSFFHVCIHLMKILDSFFVNFCCDKIVEFKFGALRALCYAIAVRRLHYHKFWENIVLYPSFYFVFIFGYLEEDWRFNHKSSSLWEMKITSISYQI